MENTIEKMDLFNLIKNCSTEYYALCNNTIKKVIIGSGIIDRNDNTNISSMIKDLILDAYLSNYDILVNDIITYNYQTEQTEGVYKFKFDDSFNPIFNFNEFESQEFEDVKDEDIPSIKGLFISCNANTEYKIYIYQEMKVKLLAKHKSRVLSMNDGVFELINKSVIGFDERIDAIFYGNEILFKDPEVLRKNFNFDSHIENKANECYKKLIKSFPCSKECDKYISKLPKKYKQKLLNVNEYDIVNYSIEKVKSIIHEDDFLSSKLKIENDTFVIKNNKDFKMYLSFFTDDIYYSRITNNSYITHDKEKCPL